MSHPVLMFTRISRSYVTNSHDYVSLGTLRYLLSVRTQILGSLSQSLRLALIRLPEVNFPQNETLRMYVGCIQP